MSTDPSFSESASSHPRPDPARPASCSEALPADAREFRAENPHYRTLGSAAAWSRRTVPSLAALPREKLLQDGASALSDRELLSVLIGTGSSQHSVYELARAVLQVVGGLRGLAAAAPSEVRCLDGLGEAKVARIFAALEIGRRIAHRPWRPGDEFVSSRQVFSHLRSRLRDEKRELFVALYLDARHRLICERVISCGSLVASIVHPREVFRPAIRVAAAAIICAHNHPSGDPRQSAEDLAITRRLHTVGRVVGIELLDHVIVGHDSYTSFVDRRLPPWDPPEGSR
ncbi:MAG: DNA repair protein RadC [Planctomycetota bacterium]